MGFAVRQYACDELVICSYSKLAYTVDCTIFVWPNPAKWKIYYGPVRILSTQAAERPTKSRKLSAVNAPHVPKASFFLRLAKRENRGKSTSSSLFGFPFSLVCGYGNEGLRHFRDDALLS